MSKTVHESELSEKTINHARQQKLGRSIDAASVGNPTDSDSEYIPDEDFSSGQTSDEEEKISASYRSAKRQKRNSLNDTMSLQQKKDAVTIKGSVKGAEESGEDEPLFIQKLYSLESEIKEMRSSQQASGTEEATGILKRQVDRMSEEIALLKQGVPTPEPSPSAGKCNTGQDLKQSDPHLSNGAGGERQGGDASTTLQDPVESKLDELREAVDECNNRTAKMGAALHWQLERRKQQLFQKMLQYQVSQRRGESGRQKAVPKVERASQQSMSSGSAQGWTVGLHHMFGPHQTFAAEEDEEEEEEKGTKKEKDEEEDEDKEYTLVQMKKAISDADRHSGELKARYRAMLQLELQNVGKF